LIVHILASRTDKGRQNTGAIVPATDVSIPEREVKKPSADPVVLFVGVIVALIFTWVIPIPFVFSFPAPNLPLLADLDVPPARDTLLTRISQNGTVEWQSVLPGYSLDLVVVKTLPGCGYIVYGTYWIPGERSAAMRAVNVDCNGTLVWDLHRSLDRKAPKPGIIQSVEIFEGKYILISADGKIIRIDTQGKILSEDITAKGWIPTEIRSGYPVGYSVSPTPLAQSISVGVRSEGGRGILFTIEDIVHHKEITSVYSVNPMADGGYLVSSSTNP
jgi:hypothetical protein